MNDQIVVHVDPELIDLIPGYLGHRRKDLADLEQALTAGDYQTVIRIGHKMKGTGKSYGFAVLGAIGEKLETDAKANKHAAVAACIMVMKDYLARVVVKAREPAA